MRYTFKVNERLKKEQHISTLFQSGKAFYVFPVKMLFLEVPRPQPTDSPVITGFSVPKKKMRLSVDRHRVRRLMVESWRLGKHTLYEALPPDKQLHLFLIYTGNALPAFTDVQKAVTAGINKLASGYKKPNDA